MKKYWTVAVLGWEDSLVYRFNALIWVLYAVLPAVTLMLVWLAAYQSGGQANIGGYDLPQMMTYYICVTALSVVITPHPEWEMAQQIRNGQITQFIVRPIGYFGYRLVQETSYQIVKSAMMLPTFALVVWLFRSYLQMPPFDVWRCFLFLLATLFAYAMLSQIKFLLGISAFWIGEPGGFMEIWNILTRVFGGGMLPLSLLPSWLRAISVALPFSSLYAFPMDLLLNRATPEDIVLGFTRQVVWIIVLSLAVRWVWRRGLLAYEAYGG
ncbi:MAG: ABC-2 family transporter protein [Armatimonadota bacterium]|nr:ABC-2 family transporter protein [Armatimonadota bacterium]